jgi:effector-binding domain-containing protein
MIDAPRIVKTSARLAAIIRVTVPRDQIQAVMGPGLSEVRAAVAAQGIAVTRPWFTHHLRMDPDVFDFEIGVPVAAPISVAGRAQPGQLPDATVVRTIYYGDFEGLGSGWKQVDDWITANGHTARADLWEVYLTGPESTSSPADWRTELNRPIVASRS